MLEELLRINRTPLKMLDTQWKVPLGSISLLASNQLKKAFNYTLELTQILKPNYCSFLIIFNDELIRDVGLVRL